MNQKISKFRGRHGIVCYTFQTHQSTHSFQHCWKTCITHAQVTPPTIAWQIKEENLCLCNTHTWAIKGLNVALADPWTAGLLKHPWWDPVQLENNMEFLPACWKLWEAKEFPSNKKSLEWEVWTNLVTYSARNLDKTRGINASRLLEGMDFPECNKGNIDWYVRMPTDPPLVVPKARKLPGQCDDGYVNLGLAFPMIES